MNQTLLKFLRMLQLYVNLTPEGIQVNQDKFHYSLTEGQISAKISTEGRCNVISFTHDLFYEKVICNSSVFYVICINYVDDCEGTIYPGEVKTGTIENYIVEGYFFI